MSEDLPFTGERFVPGTKGEIWIEHWHRYHFATRWARSRRVLDVACGEGYGTALLAHAARNVTGVDLSAEAIAHAKRTYSHLANASFTCAPCTQLPVPDASVDLAVSFETLEHIEAQDAFLDELRRVLAPGGVLLLSCPNKLEYSDKRGFANAFHVKELYRDELARLVGARFPAIAWYGQRPTFYSVIAPEGRPPGAGELFEVSEDTAGQAGATLSSPLYFILAAGAESAAIAADPPTLSVLADRDDWVHRDYVKVMGHLEATAVRADDLSQQLSKREASRADLEQKVGELAQTLQAREAALLARHREMTEQGRRLAESLAEADRRRGWRWWLRYPFVRLGLLPGRAPR